MTNQSKETAQMRQAIEDLQVSPGWLIVRDRLDKMAANEFMKMRNAKSQDELVRASITHMAFKDLADFPETLLKVLTVPTK